MLAVCTLASTARADPLEHPHTNAKWFKLGPELGTVFARDRGVGVDIGASATLVHFNELTGLWFGVQGDLLADTNGDADLGPRWTLGPEAGYSFVGGDVSYFGERVDGSYAHGIAVRPKFTIGVAAIYVRYTYAFYKLPTDDHQSFEVGIQIKPLIRPF